ncbi:uncharacterized protein LOC141589850 [Silene latifolia]|uniref:uncharacterized protein LOC141589850 n=1 Tax=Silene latifolia TaxID=37657 RepID=UPI003D7716AE
MGWFDMGMRRLRGLLRTNLRSSLQRLLGVILDKLGGMEGRVNDEMNRVLRQPYREEEVLEALNQMHPLKAPGPDGMNCLFYQTYWHIVGPVVTSTVLGILDGAPMPDEVNHTHIVLIREKKAPDKVCDFRPISLCNVIYKLVSKILANRLSFFLAEIVSVNQSAFTPGRLISDNVLIAFELFHHMKNSKSREGHMAIKLDMAKAYDRVEWDFLDRVLRVMGFDGHWVNRACEEEVVKVNDILRAYEFASGQLVSLDKTTVSFSRGLSEERQARIVGLMGVRKVEVQECYLGLPTVIGRSKKPITDIVRNKLLKRLQGWRGKILSKAGREILIKAVANSLPTYVMSIFKLPAAFCDDLRRMISRFWWGYEDGKKGISWVSWNQMCKPKCVGGMGFRDFFKSNQALLGKQAWRLLTSPDCLWAQLMRGAREGLLNGPRRRIGNGIDTLVWGDQWVTNTQTGKVLSPCFGANVGMKVSELMVTGGGAWSEEKLSMYLLPFERERVRNIRLSVEDHDDMCEVWERLGVQVEEAGGIGGIRDWVEDCWREMDKRDYGLLMVGCWALWKVRNQAVFEGEKGEIDRVVRRVQRVLEEIEGDRVAQTKLEGRLADEGQTEHVRGWTAPGEGWVKLNVDAGVKEGVGVGIGGVCRDSAGKVLWSMAARRLVV